MWVVGPVWAGCVTFGKSLPLSGPQRPLTSDEGLDLVSSCLLACYQVSLSSKGHPQPGEPAPWWSSTGTFQFQVLYFHEAAAKSPCPKWL